MKTEDEEKWLLLLLEGHQTFQYHGVRKEQLLQDLSPFTTTNNKNYFEPSDKRCS